MLLSSSTQLVLVLAAWSCVADSHHLWYFDAGLNLQGAPEAVNAIVEDTTQCKFEATSPASDEVVLFNILQVSSRGGSCNRVAEVMCTYQQPKGALAKAGAAAVEGLVGLCPSLPIV